MDQDRPWTLLARILRPQGRKGEVLADLYTDFPDRFAEQPKVRLAPPGFTEAHDAPLSDGALEAAEIISHWLPTGRNAGRVVLHFAGVNSISQAETLAGKEVVVPLTERMPLEDGAIYISDLIDCSLYDGPARIGIVEAVDFPAGADGARLEEVAPLLTVRTPDGEELLVPFAKSYLLQVDPAAKTVRMQLPEGLATLNRSAKDAN